MDAIVAPMRDLLGSIWIPVWTLAKIVVIVVPLILCVAYLTFWERKVIGWMQVRIGPNRVGFWGLLQPFADVFKLIFKEIIVPTGANRYLFFIAPILAIGPAVAAWAVIPFTETLVVADINAGLLYILAMTSMGVYGIILAGWASNSKYAFLGALRSAAQIVSYELAIGPAVAAWAVIPFTDTLVVADINAGLLYILAMTSMGVYGIILAGWASNSKYAFLGALRSAAQIVSYELAMGFALVAVLMCANSLNLREIVLGQEGGAAYWYVWPLLPMFVVYLVSGIAETNRHPFDLAEGESEIVAGFHVEYSGVAFAVFFLAEYMNMILIAVLASILFLGGWLSPFPALNDLVVAGIAPFGDGLFWLGAKMAFILLIFLWVRATFPRYRYDQVMRLGWKVFIPLTLVWIVFVGTMLQTRYAPLFH